MTTSDRELRLQLLRKAFRMPSAQTMMSRKSSITNAFVNAVIPVATPSIEEVDEVLSILGSNPTMSGARIAAIRPPSGIICVHW